MPAPLPYYRRKYAVSRSVRAPNLSDLWQLPGQNFSNNFNDPCSARNIGTSTGFDRLSPQFPGLSGPKVRDGGTLGLSASEHGDLRSDMSRNVPVQL